MASRLVVLIALLATVVAGTTVATPERVAAASTIEAHYAAPGPWSITTTHVVDHAARSYRLIHPTNLGAGGFNHPVVTWGNGSLGSPDNYPGVLNLLASWGFVVVAFTGSTTRTGVEILGGAQWAVAANDDPHSVFHHHIDTGNIGAVGHSQGAGGSINATAMSGGLITTTVPIALPQPLLVTPDGQFDVAALDAPVFFLGGNLDLLIAPPSAISNYYDEVDGPAAMAILRGADHNTIQHSGGRFLGYLNAWLMYQLQNDSSARAAFVGNPAELHTNTAWTDQADKNLA